MSTNTTSLDLLLREIKDPYVQENFYRLKLYLEQLAVGNTTIINQSSSAPSVSAPTTQFTKVMNCDASLPIGAWVYQSQSVNNFAVAAVDNDPPDPVIGLVSDKPSGTQCEVVLSGIVNIVLSRGRVFLDGTGQASVSAPSSGHIQKLGISFGDGTMFINPETTRIKRL